MERKKAIISSLACIAGCAALAGCQEKPEGPQAVIIELADPSDTGESVTEGVTQEQESVSESDTEAVEGSGEIQSAEAEDRVQLEGLQDGIRLEYTRIASDDPVVGLLAAGLLPEDIKLEDFSATNVQAYKGDEEIIPAGSVTFELAVEEGAQVMLYRLNEDGELVSEMLEAADGLVSYEAQGCGRWLVLDAEVEAEAESVSEPDTESAGVK